MNKIMSACDRFLDWFFGDCGTLIMSLICLAFLGVILACLCKAAWLAIQWVFSA